MSSVRPAAQEVTRADVALAIALASTSGAAILAQTFTATPMVLTVPFLVMPSSILLAAIILLRRRLYQRFRTVANLVRLGAGIGLMATLAYDVIRPLVQHVFGFKYAPFGAMPIFGHLITGLPSTSVIAITSGWIYHFWNGASFGMMFALLLPKGGWLVGLLWGLGLECLMLVTYPHLLRVRLDDPGFLATSLIGHSLWGVILGFSVSKWRPRA